MVKKYVLDETKTAITDINASGFENRVITFPSEIDGHKITSIGISKDSLLALSETFGEFDVVIEDGIETIAEKMFIFSSINTVSIPPSIKTIPAYCFRESKLKKVIFTGESSLETIDKFAFSFCDLGSISLPDSVTEIKENAFRGSSLKEITFPESKELSIWADAFNECHLLKSVTFPEVTAKLADGIFAKCDTLESVVMDKVNTDAISISMFSGCTMLQSITLPKTVKTIFESAFAYCTHLKSVGLANTQVTDIRMEAFLECSSYSDGKFPDTLGNIGVRAFFKCNIDKLCLPSANLKGVGRQAFQKNPLTKDLDLTPLSNCIIIGEYVFSETNVKSVKLVPFNGKLASAEYMFASCPKLKEVNMEPGAKLAKGMFSTCHKLENVTLCDSLESIPDYTFIQCESITTIKFPKSLTKIGDKAFQFTDLVSVDLSKSKSMDISHDAFAYTQVKKIWNVKLPPYSTFYRSSFRSSIIEDILEEHPFVTVIQD